MNQEEKLKRELYHFEQKLNSPEITDEERYAIRCTISSIIGQLKRL